MQCHISYGRGIGRAADFREHRPALPYLFVNDEETESDSVEQDRQQERFHEVAREDPGEPSQEGEPNQPPRD